MTKYVTKDFIKRVTQMNDRDTDNLYFLLKAPAEVLLDWYEQVEEDDHVYAKELLSLFQEAIDSKIIEQKIEEMSSFEDVNLILKKF